MRLTKTIKSTFVNCARVDNNKTPNIELSKRSDKNENIMKNKNKHTQINKSGIQPQKQRD